MHKSDFQNYAHLIIYTMQKKQIQNIYIFKYGLIEVVNLKELLICLTTIFIYI